MSWLEATKYLSLGLAQDKSAAIASRANGLKLGKSIVPNIRGINHLLDFRRRKKVTLQPPHPSSHRPQASSCFRYLQTPHPKSEPELHTVPQHVHFTAENGSPRQLLRNPFYAAKKNGPQPCVYEVQGPKHTQCFQPSVIDDPTSEIRTASLWCTLVTQASG